MSDLAEQISEDLLDVIFVHTRLNEQVNNQELFANILSGVSYFTANVISNARYELEDKISFANKIHKVVILYLNAEAQREKT